MIGKQVTWMIVVPADHHVSRPDHAHAQDTPYLKIEPQLHDNAQAGNVHAVVCTVVNRARPDAASVSSS